MMAEFDDSRLDDPAALALIDDHLRHVAAAGARLRIEAASSQEGVDALRGVQRPRALVALGPEARLLRAALETTGSVPFVAWPAHGLPPWVGPLDLAVVLAPSADDIRLLPAVFEAARRGCQLIIACPPGSALLEHVVPRTSTVLSMTTGDSLATALVVLQALHALDLGPHVPVDQVADAVDRVAEMCSPHVDVASNPAKDLAFGLADAQPLIWGGSTLSKRVSRRIAEAIRQRAGRAALAADANELLPVLAATPARDPFADPFEDAVAELRPALIIVNDGREDEIDVVDHRLLTNAADDRDIRVCDIEHTEGSEFERYAATLQHGRFAAAYLGLGLGIA